MSSSSSPTFKSQESGANTDDELYQKFTNVVLSWPSFPALARNPLYRHPNGWYATLAPMVSTMVADACFAARPSDIIIATAPKSGTTWIKAMLYSTVHRREHPAGGGSGHPLNSLGPHECVKFLEYQLYAPNRVPDLDELPDPRLFATHAPFVSLPRSVAASGCKIVYVCRDPKDALVSQWSFVNKYRARDGMDALSVETAADFFCDGATLSGPHWDHVLGYWRAHLAHPERVLFLRYEEMSRDPAACVRKLAEFVGRPFGVGEEEAGAVDAIVKLCSFEHMTGLDVIKVGKTELLLGTVENSWFFRRGHVGDWKNHLSPETARRIDAITEARFKGPRELSGWPEPLSVGCFVWCTMEYTIAFINAVSALGIMATMMSEGHALKHASATIVLAIGARGLYVPAIVMAVELVPREGRGAPPQGYQFAKLLVEGFAGSGVVFATQ